MEVLRSPVSCKYRAFHRFEAIAKDPIGIHWGNIRVIVELYGDNGKENGNYYNSSLVWDELWHRVQEHTPTP